ncbi:MAG: phosphotransferase [Alphaproteobacteria bacterium]|nr:phosphotransferase [Alphaproteobacteria bacterium]
MVPEQEYMDIIKKTFPELNIDDFKILGKGHFGVACSVNNNIVFKIPIENSKRFNDQKKEVYLLKKLENKLSFEIPRILYNKEIPNGMIIGETLVHGVTYSQELHDSFDEAIKSDVLRQLGKMMRELHGVKIHDEQGVLFVSDYKDILHLFYKNFTEDVQKCFNDADTERIRKLCNRYEYLSTHYPVELVLVHADLHFGNMMFDVESKKIIGLIDFGSAHFAEPARDMHYYYGDGLKSLLDGYGVTLDPYLVERQNFQAVINFLFHIRDNIESKKSPDKDIQKLLSIL